jgi:hypothetical protein
MQKKKNIAYLVEAICDCGSQVEPYTRYSNEGTEHGIFCPQCKKFEKTDRAYPYFERPEENLPKPTDKIEEPIE